MDPEKSSNSSFEDLSTLNETIKTPEFNEPETIATSTVTSSSSSDQKDKEDNKHDNNDAEDDDVMDLIGNGQILKKTIKKGHSDMKPQSRDFVKINYIGKLEDGTVVEDEKNVEIQVGDFEVVQGLDMAIPLMTIGEIAEISLEPRFAYGSIGLKNDDPNKSIPPNAKINYVVELLECEPEDEDKLCTFATRKRLGNRKRERANFWYNRNNFNVAITIYRRALEYLDDANVGGGKDVELTNSELQELLEDRLVVYNNLAMSQIKINAYDAALMAVENVLRCQPNNSKALFRKGRILDGKGDTKGAIALLQKAAILEPESKSIQQDLAKLILKNRREERNEKEMYQKMLGQAKKLEQAASTKKQQQKTSDIPKLKLLGYVMGSILIGVAGVAVYRYKY